MDGLVQDVKYAVRRLVSSPAVTVVAILSLALGVGANTTIFSAVDTLLLRSLPYEDADRLVRVWMSIEGRDGRFTNTLPDLLDLGSQTDAFESIAAFRGVDLNFTGGDRAERVNGIAASASLFSTLGVRPRLGRAYTAADDRPDAAERVVVLSHAFWQRRFGGTAEAIGETIRLSDVAHTIIGVMPPGFAFPFEGVDVWVPLRDDATTWGRGRGGMNSVARLAPGVSLERARSEAAALADRLAEAYPATNLDRGYIIDTLAEAYYGPVLRRILFVLFGAVGLVLLIACANVANLLLARAVGREKEIAVRTAIGAGRGRVVRQLLTESVVLALAGGGLGVLVAAWASGWLVTAVPEGMVHRLDSVTVDGRVLLFTTLLSVLTGLLFGIVPALRAARTAPGSVLRDGGGRGGSAGPARGRLLRTLVAAQVALALVLLVGAGLMIRSLTALLAVDPGFDADRLLVVNYSLGTRHTTTEEAARFHDAVLDRIAALPGVEAASVVNTLPMGSTTNYQDFRIEGREPPDGRPFNTGNLFVGPDYFRAMGIPLVRGRALERQDARGAPGVALINRAMAERFWPGEDPIGRRVTIGWEATAEGPYWRTIVGVVEDSRFLGLNRAARPELYLPLAQLPWRPQQATFVVRVEPGDPAAIAAAVQAEIRAVDPEIPLFDIAPMRRVMRDHASIAPLRTAAGLLGLFGAIALCLAAIGLYGVISYSVAQRTHEIGIRGALGADRASVLRLVLGQGMRTVAIGVAVGLAGAFAATRVLTGLLFGVDPADPVTFGGVALVLAAVALLAMLVPAGRAARVDPMVALRAE